MFAGTPVLNLVIQQLNNIGNVMNSEMNAHARYDKVEWWTKQMRIMARYEFRAYWGGFIILSFVRVTYTFKKLVRPDISGPGYIRLKNGVEIAFGKVIAEDVQPLGSCPSPPLCNLQYAV